MARAEYTDIIVNSEGHPIRGVELKPGVHITVHAGSAGEAIFWAGETGTGTLTSIKSNAQGFFQVWLTEGRYDVAIPHFQITKTIDLINQSTVSAGGFGTISQVNGVGPDGSGHVKLPGLTESGGATLSTTVTARVKSLGSVTGNVTPNLAEGDVFKAVTTGPITIQKPTNFAGARKYFVLEVEGNHAITFGSWLKGWREGAEPPQNLESSASVNAYEIFTDDGTSFYGIGLEPLPSDVVRVTGQADQQLAGWNAAESKWEGKTVSPGISKAATEALIAELGLPPEGPTGTGVIPITNSEGIVFWVNLQTLLNEDLTPEPNAASRGFLLQSFDIPTVSFQMIAKTIHIAKVMVPFSATIKEIYAEMPVEGKELTAGYVGIYNSSGTLLGKSANLKTGFEAAAPSPLAMKLESSTALTGGKNVYVYVALLAVGTTPPTLGSAGFVTSTPLRDMNAALTASTLLAGEARNTAGEIAAYSTLPSTIDAAKSRGKTTDLPYYWVGLL